MACARIRIRRGIYARHSNVSPQRLHEVCMKVYMKVCMNVDMKVCMNVHMKVCMNVHMKVCMNVHMKVCMKVHMKVCMEVHTKVCPKCCMDSLCLQVTLHKSLHNTSH